MNKKTKEEISTYWDNYDEFVIDYNVSDWEIKIHPAGEITLRRIIPLQKEKSR